MRKKLSLGNLGIIRDWGWAPEYVDAMWRMLQADVADDFVIATGEANSLKEFVDQAFAHFGLDAADHVVHDEKLLRPNEIPFSQGNPQKAFEKLGWKATKRMKDVVKILAEAQGVRCPPPPALKSTPHLSPPPQGGRRIKQFAPS